MGAKPWDTYMEVQLDFTPGMEVHVLYMLLERFHTKNRKRLLQQHLKYFNFRSKIQLDHPVHVLHPLVRLLWVLQEEHPPEPDLHVQGPGRLQGPLPHRQDAPEPVQGLQAQKVLRVIHEQRR